MHLTLVCWQLGLLYQTTGKFPHGSHWTNNTASLECHGKLVQYFNFETFQQKFRL